jgi:hypothetical protein
VDQLSLWKNFSVVVIVTRQGRDGLTDARISHQSQMSHLETNK